MSRHPFNSVLCRQPVNLTHCREINREQKTVRINCWQLTSTTVKPWNPHWFQDVQQPTEEGGGRLCSGGVWTILSVTIWYTVLHTHTHTRGDNIYTPSFPAPRRSLSTTLTHPAQTSIFISWVLKPSSTTAGWNVKRPLGFSVFLMNYKSSSSS